MAAREEPMSREIQSNDLATLPRLVWPQCLSLFSLFVEFFIQKKIVIVPVPIHAWWVRGLASFNTRSGSGG